MNELEPLRVLAGAAHAIRVELPAGVPDPAAARARLENGIAALTGEPLAGWETLIRTLASLTDALRAAGVPIASDPLALQQAGSAVRDGIVAAALSGAWHALPIRSPPDALVALLDWAARPALRAGARALAPLPVESWKRGRCPACGAPPVLSVVSGKERSRRLYCGRCGTGWAYPRTRCPECGEQRQERLGYLHAPGEADHRRAEVCDSCRTYVKSVALLDPPGADRLLALDLETIALDFAALDGGYARL